MTTIFQCPVCAQSLIKQDRRYTCANNHHFDRAREGYVNLLLANQKNSSDPGDSRAMLQHRRAFLDQGYYQPLAEAIVNMLKQDDQPDAPVILDVGCGEGYYTDYVQQAITGHQTVYGIDIAKDAVRYAAKRNSALDLAVASVAQLPVADDSVDVILSIFSPRDLAEMHRLVTHEGLLLTATPAPDHLRQLRELIYDEVRPYAHTPTDAMQPYFDHRDAHHIQFEITLDHQASIQNLLQMTPFYWHTPYEKQQALLTLDHLSLTVSFELSIWQRAVQ